MRVTVVSMADDQRLPTRRFLLLIDQVAEDRRAEAGKARPSRKATAKDLGVDPSYVVKLRTESWREVGVDILTRVQSALGVQPAFFHDAALGEEPHYRDHLVATHVEREADEGHPAIEHFIAAHPEATPAQQAELRSLRRSLGPDSITEEVLLGMFRGLRARDTRRELERPVIEASIEEERGQRPLPPTKRRRQN
jgi:hypothetical protein